MGTLLLDQIKKHTSSFIHEKYKVARLAFTDVTEAELLAEEATNSDPISPDAKTMTTIAAASFFIDDYWRIVDILHRRLDAVDWKLWRQSYKSLVLLEFLLTHGPEDFAEEFQCDAEIIQELGTFNYIDEKGFNWGASMQKKSDEILKLLGGGVTLREARLKALKITNEIQGFGSSISSPSSSTSSTSSSDSPGASSFGSFNSAHSAAFEDVMKEHNKFQASPKEAIIEAYSKRDHDIKRNTGNNNSVEYDDDADYDDDGKHVWNCPSTEEEGTLLDPEYEEREKHSGGFVSGICSKLVGGNPSSSSGRNAADQKLGFRSLSDAGRLVKKKFDRQFTFWY